MRRFLARSATITAFGFVAWSLLGSDSYLPHALFALGFALGAAADIPPMRERRNSHDRR